MRFKIIQQSLYSLSSSASECIETFTVKITDNGKIEKIFTKPLESDIIPRCKVGSERYFTAGDCILNGKGEFVASVSAVNANEVYLVTTNAIYDYNKNKLFDIKAHDFSVDLITDGAVFMQGKDGKRYLHKGKELVSLGSVLSVKNKGQALVEVRCDSGYDYYNGYGEKLLSSESELFFAGKIGQSVYYRTAGYNQTWRFW